MIHRKGPWEGYRRQANAVSPVVSFPPSFARTSRETSGYEAAPSYYQKPTPRQNVYACASLSISGQFFSHTFQSDQSLPRALRLILCAACGSVVLLYAARVFDYFVVIEIAFMDNQAQITETISRPRRVSF